jgi:SRSO17 transposase
MEIKQLEELRGRLDEFVGEFDDCIKTRPSREHLRTYVNGQLGPLDRKSVEPIALDAGVPPRSLQEFLSLHRWDHEKTRRRVKELVVRRHASDRAVAVIDETSFAKKGDDTCGIQPQWCGETGKIDNCVVTVHIGYATDDFHALVDCDLFLPEKTWGTDPELREKAGIPEDVTYRPKWRIAVDLLKRTVADGVRFKYAVADELYGRTCGFRQELADLGLLYVVEVPRSTRGWTAARSGGGELAPRRVEALWKRGGPSWEGFHVKDTEKGPVVWKARAVRFRPLEEEVAGDEGWLIVARNVLTDEVKYFLSNAPERTRRETMLHVAFTRWHVEKLFKESKGEIGLGHFEVRRYLPVIRHLVLSMASLLFLVEQTERLRGEKPVVVEHLPGEGGCRVSARSREVA